VKQVLASLEDTPLPRISTRIGTLPLGAKEFAPRIAELLKDGVYYVRGSATLALGQLKATEFAPPIAECLRDGNNYVRGMAAIALMELGQVADVRVQAEKGTRILEDIKSVTHWNGLEARAKAALKALGVEEEKR
jgi:HEAT repeat protein